MIEHTIPEIGSWDHSGGCQGCSYKGPINRFVLSASKHSGGWVVRICESCLNKMVEMSKNVDLIS